MAMEALSTIIPELSGIVSASSYLSGHAPANAIDEGNPSLWKAPSYYAWWLYDLESVCHLDSLFIDTAAEGTLCYYIETSSDRLNWTLIGETGGEGQESGTWPVLREARFIRITFTYASSGQDVQLLSVRAYGWAMEPRVAEPHHAGDRFYAASCSSGVGFIKEESVGLEAGWKATVMQSSTAGSALRFDDIDFGERSNQLRGSFGLLNPDRSLKVDLEIRLDAEDGPLIATMQIFRQWICWSELACDIEETSGRHTVYLVITRLDEGQTLQICHLAFTTRTPLPESRPAPPLLEDEGELTPFIGLLHSHTGFSDGANVPDYAYAYARDVGGLDFLGITEHSNLFDEPFDFQKSRKLKGLREAAQRATEEGRFVGLIGSETTWYNQFGHMSIYSDDLYLNAYEVKYNTISTYYETISRWGDVINQWNHPWSCGVRHLDSFSPYDEKLDRVMHLLEVNPYEDPDQGGLIYYIKALEMGYHVAPCGSQDNHKEDWGTQNNLRTGILSPRLTKAHLLDAIRRRRVYFTCCPSLRVIYRLNGRVMGSRIARPDHFECSVQAEVSDRSAELRLVEILGSGGSVVAQKTVEGYRGAVTLSITDCHASYLFARVQLSNGEFAVTSPVWIA